MTSRIQELASLALEYYDDAAAELDDLDPETAALHSAWLLAVQADSMAKAADPNYRFDPMSDPLAEPQSAEVTATFDAYWSRLQFLAG